MKHSSLLLRMKVLLQHLHFICVIVYGENMQKENHTLEVGLN